MPAARHLPLPRLPLIGREAEMVIAKSLLQRDDVGLITLTGAGGIGKTRLALQIGAELESEFVGGVFFIPLAPLSASDLLMPTLARAFGVGDEPGRDLLAGLGSRLQAERLLLILDNFEHLIAAASELAELLTLCPELKLLATSRERLSLQEEQVIPVPQLALPGAAASTPELLRHSEAVRLFAARARAVKPDFALTMDNLTTIGELCRRLDGLPLAIELAAARAMTLSPQLLLEKLGDPLTLLSGGPHDLPARLQTLRDTVAWSYDLLSVEEKLLLKELSVFSGDWSLAAAEAVSAREDTLLLLTQLVNKSLVVTVPHTLPADGLRFRLLETIRHYALEKLRETPQEEARARDAHAHYYLNMLAAQEGALKSRWQQAALASVSEVMENVRTAWRWAAAEGRLALLLASVEALWLVYAHHGLHNEAESLCAQAASTFKDAREPEEKRLLGKLLRGQGSSSFRLGFYAKARYLLSESIRLFRELELPQETAFSLNQLAATAHLEGRYIEEKQLLEESIALSLAEADRWLRAYSLNDLGFVTYLLGDTSEAQRLSGQSLDFFQELNDQRGVAFALNNLGVFAASSGALIEATALHQQSLLLRRANDDAWGIAASLLRLAVVARLGKDEDVARAHLKSALQAALKIYALPTILEICCELAALQVENKRADLAEPLLTIVLAHPTSQRDVRDKASRLATPSAPPTRMLNQSLEAALPIISETLALSEHELSIVKAQLEGAPAPPAYAQAYTKPTHRDELTPREAQVLRLIAKGKSNQDIAVDLGISTRTAERHISTIYEKIGARGKVARATATAYAYRHGFAPD